MSNSNALTVAKARALYSSSQSQKILNTINKNRETIYCSVADFIIDTDGKTPYEVAETIKQKIGW